MPENQPSSTPTRSAVSRRDVLKHSTAAATSAALFAALGTNFAYAQAPNKIKVGLVGLGGRGRGAAGNVVEADPKGVVIHAIGDLFPEKIGETRELWKDKPKENFDYAGREFHGWDAYKQVLATDIDYVILATPPGFRPMQIAAAIEAGKHVFAEKPVATDAPGCRAIMEAGKLAASKNLGIVAGTQRRHDPMHIETLKRLEGGAIGRIITGQIYWTGNTLWSKPRQPGWSDMEYQIRNWQYFPWLSGDLIVEQHVHNIDVANWVMGEHPRLALCMGGAQARVGPEYGVTYDHFATDFEYKDDRHVLSFARQQDACYNRVAHNFQGDAGTAMVEGGRITPAKGSAWRFPPKLMVNPYVQEHADLLASIRAGKPLNEAQRIAESVLTAIMARMSAYSGQIVTWQLAMNSKVSLMPEKLEFGPLPEPHIPIPGKDKLI
ncbi:MAG TPA: Gfo/Idh/MocA family oxidoreductase [Tepidisphaeraceae bacterium]|jgi:predicted dehydrogenase